MIDIHPAPHAASSWREFFIHIATIVLGLLIALALEQTVARIHRHQEVQELEANLRDESLTNRRLVQYDYDSVNQVRRNIRRNMVNLDREGKDFTPIPPPHDTFLPFVDTAWVAARASGLIPLLPEQVSGSYWRVNVIADAMTGAIASLADARKKVNSLLYLHASPAQLTPDERNQLLRAYSEEDQEIGNLTYILITFDYTNEAALAGRIPTIAEITATSERAQKFEGKPPRP